ncbi:hypothetical protein DICVIV_02763 [Dictyocaulus viviparus]|uniref:Uncharacterized protein n=1 Tax=Dictyocaulus viviparus TaxID=29172 RepID=A0A0D8Y926_DICVI|nr:hypothetical protein DICVIV_02763 [Dictyocaulus viviparus]
MRHGLTSEECPPAAVGCRIKVLSNKIVWYPVSKMYDRNQMVCVYPLEYEGTAGCVPKPSGDIRCWCHNVSDCNDEITSAQLLDAFLTSNTKKMQAIVKRLETGKRVDYDVIDDESDC